MPRREISNSDAVIDSRDVISRIEALETEISDANEAGDAPDVESVVELNLLRELAEEADQYAEDWPHGVVLIRYSHFEDYCRELVEDIGDMPRGIPSYIVIDWEATARNLKVDYTSVDFDGVEYLVR